MSLRAFALAAGLLLVAAAVSQLRDTGRLPGLALATSRDPHQRDPRELAAVAVEGATVDLGPVFRFGSSSCAHCKSI